MIFIVASPQADGGSVGDWSFLFVARSGHFRPITIMAQPLWGCSATGFVAGFDGRLGSHPTASPITAQHLRHQAILKSLALPANPWDDAFG
ncbi:MAG: hypothetical protein E5W98_04160 [Mesorhizobium sp.]|nr:MAG: hypothetical protein E5W98_04160 [Mesorhizobium sp.]